MAVSESSMKSAPGTNARGDGASFETISSVARSPGESRRICAASCGADRRGKAQSLRAGKRLGVRSSQLDARSDEKQA